MTRTSAALIVLSTVGLTGAASADVLIAGAPSGGAQWLEDVRSVIEATGKIGGNVDSFDLSNGTPNLALLQSYDSVLIFTDTGPQNANLLGDNLADYVDTGGGVVLMTFYWNIGNGGRFVTDGYSPLDVGSQTQGVQQGIGDVFLPNHPILDNVTTFDGGSSSYHNTGGFAAGSTQIAEWEDDLPFAAEMTGFTGRPVALNFYPVSSNMRSDFWNINTDGGQLMANALNYAAPTPGALALLGLAAIGGRRRRHD